MESRVTQLPSTMSGQTSGGEAGPPSRSNQRTFLDDVVLTFSSPMAWLLVVALVLTWSGVAIVLFDLLDYKTLAGPNDNFHLLTLDGIRSRNDSLQESDDWLEMIWSFAASLVAPDEEEEG
uniref:Triadin n=1 Tax=Poecilia formosa TaxID=48698 RepID=A0A096MFJ8_POEFO